MFDSFAQRRIATTGAEINLVIGGEGPPVLLLHGFPQTLAMWHAVAPRLAEHYTVVAADLRGCGASEKVPSDERHAAYAKRAVAFDQVEVMAALGFRRFAVVGHDRGARVAHRMALDHPDRVERLAVLDIVPTLAVFEATNQSLATDLFHWFFLIQPRGFPEHLIGLDPEYVLRRFLGSWGGEAGMVDEAAFNEYARAFRDHATVHAFCEDYRAAATIDLEHDRADRDGGRRVGCPLLALWGRRGTMAGHFDVLEVWRGYGDHVSGRSIDSGHYLAEEKPDETAAVLLEFLEG